MKVFLKVIVTIMLLTVFVSCGSSNSSSVESAVSTVSIKFNYTYTSGNPITSMYLDGISTTDPVSTDKTYKIQPGTYKMKWLWKYSYGIYSSSTVTITKDSKITINYDDTITVEDLSVF